MDDHRSNNVAQHIGKCDDPQQSAFFATLSFFFLLASINQWICPRKLTSEITNLSFNDDQAMNTSLFDELKKRA